MAAVASLADWRAGSWMESLLDTPSIGPPVRHHRDERLATIDVTATAGAGIAVILTIIIAFIVDLSRGGDGMPYAWLGAIGAVAYVVSVIVLRVRG